VILAVSAFGVVGCASVPPSIHTNERPRILDHPSVLTVSEHDAESSDSKFLDAAENKETFGYCLPIGPPTDDSRPVLCLITELGEVYAIVDQSGEDESTSRYEIGPAIRKTETRYFLPLLDAEIALERD
jgi:hypothetical protein